MIKWLIIILMMVILSLGVSAVDCQISLDNTTWTNIASVLYGGYIDDSNNVSFAQNLEENTLYYARCKNETDNWGYTTFKTGLTGEIGMSAIAVILTYIGIAALFILISFQVDKNYQLVKQICFYSSFAFMALGLINMYIISRINYSSPDLNTMSITGITLFGMIIIIIIWITGAEHIERLAERLFGKL